MRLLINPQLHEISSAISGDFGDIRIVSRLESYSCKLSGGDKRLFKQIFQDGGDADATVALSPSSLSPSAALLASSASYGTSRELSGSASEQNVLAHTCSTRTLFYLKATLNAAFAPDYDFSRANPAEFSKEPSIEWISRSINNFLDGVPEWPKVSASLWQNLSTEIVPEECDVYSYNPDLDSDPFYEEGTLWSFNYFLYNKKLKRIVFFRASAFSYNSASSEDEDLAGDSDDMDMSDDEFGYMEGY